VADQQSNESWIEIAMNVIAPTVALLTLTSEDRLGPMWGLVVALGFPVAHSMRGLLRSERPSPFAWLALVSILLTAGIGLFELDGAWLALKEAALPGGLGVMALISARTQGPGIDILLDRMMDTQSLKATLVAKDKEQEWSQVTAEATRHIGYLFFFSAAANFGLARWLVQSEGGTEAFAEELAYFTTLSFPVIAVPMTIGMGFVLRKLLIAMETHTGRPMDDFLP